MDCDDYEASLTYNPKAKHVDYKAKQAKMRVDYINTLRVNGLQIEIVVSS